MKRKFREGGISFMQNIEQWPISQPIPYARNARKIPEKAIKSPASKVFIDSFMSE